MASFERRGRAWRARVMVDGQRESMTFPTKGQAVAWANLREAELAGARLPDHTLAAAFKRYADEVAPRHAGERWERVRCDKLAADKMARKRIGDIKPADLAAWRDESLKTLAPASVAREMNLIRSVLEVARKEWGWIRENPIRDVAWPQRPRARRRRISEAEIDAIQLGLGYDGGEPENLSQRVALAFLFALETAMRGGEITGLRWRDVHERHVVLPRTKNGDRREVPLSTEARRILSLLPRGDGPVFGLRPEQRDALFRKGRDKAKVVDLHFHDSRAEAIYRLSRKLDVLELARVIGHRDLRSLLIYYQATADELASKLD